MTYSKVNNKTQDKDVKYLNKDYNSFKNQLTEFAEVYFPKTFNDLSEGNPAMMFLEMSAYVGDILSFYCDTQLRETLLATAQETENIYNLAYAMGYKPKVTAASSVELEVFQLVPAKSVSEINATLPSGGTGVQVDYKPDYSYALEIGATSTFKSSEGTMFYTINDVRFDYSSSLDPTNVSIYQYNTAGTQPEYFLLKKKVKAISGEVKPFQ